MMTSKERFTAKIALIGGMDERVLESNDLQAVERELAAKVPGAMAGRGYVLQVDHSVSDRVDYATYRFFVERGLELGRYAG
jgi:uroporphyrinogen decarboxylase